MSAEENPEGKKILVVEDELIFADDLREILRSMGFRVTGIATTGEKAVEQARKDPPDLVLMDIMLAGRIDGTEAAEAILAERTVPVIYLTAYADEQIIAKAKRTGPYGYIIKPFEPRELFTAITIALYRFEADMKLREGYDRLETIVQERTEELQRTNEKLHILAGITRHDIRNKLAIISGITALIRRQTPDETITSFTQRIDKSIRAITAQLDFSKAYESLGESQPVWQDVRAVAEQAREIAGLPDDSVRIDLDGIQVMADPMLDRVFVNLFENSLRHNTPAPQIRIHRVHAGKETVILFEDNGTGIPEEDKENIFRRGFGKGTGLGLFLARQILALTGLTIRETGEPGQGARFEICVPGGASRVNLPEK